MIKTALRSIPRFIKNPKKRGLPPGTIVHIGKKRTEHVSVTLWEYDHERCQEEKLEDLNTLKTRGKTESVMWVNVDGIHDTEIVRKIGEQFGLHPLLLEDVANTAQRPKMEDYEEALFLVTKMVHYDAASRELSVEQVSFVLMQEVLISLQEQSQDFFDDIRERIRTSKGRIRDMGADYLMYRLLDAIVDGYFETLVTLGDQIEELEKRLLDRPDDSTLAAIHHLQRELVFVRKAILPLREVLAMLQHEEGKLIQSKTIPYFRDVHDHIIQVTDAVDTYRDMASNMLSNYLSIVSNRMNEVMKVLTVIATIFIPLTFIAGVYGMNFQNMPELQWTWGYPAVWGLMMGVVLLMVVYFKRKGWW